MKKNKLKFLDYSKLVRFIYKDENLSIEINSIEDLEETIGKDFNKINMGDILEMISSNPLLKRTLEKQYTVNSF